MPDHRTDDTPPLDLERFAPTFHPPPGLRVLVGGVSELFQHDLDLGRLVVNQLLRDGDEQGGVFVEDLSYGAIPFTHRLMELRPDVLVLVGANQRDGREPGSLHRRRVVEVDRSPSELQGAVGDAYVGYVDLDLAIEVAFALGLLPDRTVVIEVQAELVGPGEELSDAVQAAIEPTVAAVRREVTLAPLFDLVARIRPRLAEGVLEPSATRDALCRVVEHLDVLDDEGRWGGTFGAKDRLRLAIASGEASTDMEHADWGLVWGLVEELVRLEALSVTDPTIA